MSAGLIAYTVCEFCTSDASTGPGELVLRPGGTGPGLVTGVGAGGGAPLATLCFSANSRSCGGKPVCQWEVGCAGWGRGRVRTWRICCWLSLPSLASWPSWPRLFCSSFAICALSMGPPCVLKALPSAVMMAWALALLPCRTLALGAGCAGALLLEAMV